MLSNPFQMPRTSVSGEVDAILVVNASDLSSYIARLGTVLLGDKSMAVL